MTRWFAAGFGLSLALSSVLSDAFAAAKPSASDLRRDLNRAAERCGIKAAEWNQCLDASQRPFEHKRYIQFIEQGGSERLATQLRARGLSSLHFIPSRYFGCELSDELLRVHPDAVGLQVLLSEILEHRSQGELEPTEIRIETIPEELLRQGIQKRVEMQGGALVLRAVFGSCATLETRQDSPQETGARSRFLGYELSRKLFRP